MNKEIIKAPQKRFEETIVFVPFYNGHKLAMKKHVDFMNRLGFDAVVFDLTWSFANPISSKALIGVKHIWADQIEAVFNEIPGPKIVFAFSNPSASAFEAIARRNASDIKGMICDSGPSAELWTSIYQYFKLENPIKTPLARLAVTTLSTLMWSPFFTTAVHEDLNKIPKDFKILSIRGWKDPLITASQIDKIFDPHLQIDLQKLSLPHAAHLNGLKDFPQDYEPAVGAFLESLGTKSVSSELSNLL